MSIARAFLLIGLLCLCAIGGLATAQTNTLVEDHATKDDRGFLTGLLEDSLGGEGRTVRIVGFNGALSSNATIDQITISDADGIWLTMGDLSLEWSRSALLRGRIEVAKLSAKQVDLARLPVNSNSSIPAPEAGGFALPNLPVSVQVDAFSIEQITLGAPVLGSEAMLSLDAAMRLDSGSGGVSFEARRIDGPVGAFVVEANYQADEQVMKIAVDLTEAEGGIVSSALDLPGRPNLRLIMAGEGPLDDLVTQISLDTDGTRRVTGSVVLRETLLSGRGFTVDLKGDLAPLLPSQYAQSFGDGASLTADGTRAADGAFELSMLSLQTGAVDLRGELSLNAELWPTFIALSGQIASQEETPVLLPFSGPETYINRAAIELNYDAATSEDVTASFDLLDLVSTDLDLQFLRIDATGALKAALSETKDFQARMTFEANGADFSDASLQRALGDMLQGSLRLKYEEGGTLELDQIDVAGATYGLTGHLAVAGLSEGFNTKIDTDLRADDLSRFSDLIGQQLTGSANLSIAGSVDLGGEFALAVEGSALKFGVGIEQADALLSGKTFLTLEALRDDEGTRLPLMDLRNDQFELTGTANLKTDASSAQFNLSLYDSTTIDDRLSGPIMLDGQAAQDPIGWRITTRLNGPYGADGTVDGQVTGESPSLNFDLRLPDINPLVPQFQGAASVTGTATRDSDGWQVNTTLTGPYGVNGTVAGRVTGSTPRVSYSLRVPDVAALGVQISGPLNLDGTAQQSGAGWQIGAVAAGLSGTRAELLGQVGTGSDLDFTATGSAPLALANPFLAPRNLQGIARFNLALRGKPDLTGLSGTITTTDARLSAPNFKVALTKIDGNANFSRGTVQLDLTAAVSSGGGISVRGPIALSGGMPADLTLQLKSVGLSDPTLYQTSLEGQLQIRGALSGGALIDGLIEVDETNIQIPSTGTSGFAIIPQIAHVNASPKVRQTIARAGLDQTISQSSAQAVGPSYPLNIQVNAPSRIFVRGRGLDAELGGALTLTGRTDRLVSSGQFSLVRGRLEILGKRFDLEEGSILLQGDLEPILRFVAVTETTAGTASVIIEGLASEPQVSFTSTPEAPQDEVLAQIFFGRNFSQISAFQALQLASAVATLAGKGGESIISKLRRNFGLDDLDITTDAQGNTGLRLGKYISDNVYTDVSIGDADTAGASVNIDLTPNLTARGQVKANGESSIGVFFERDY